MASPDSTEPSPELLEAIDRIVLQFVDLAFDPQAACGKPLKLGTDHTFRADPVVSSKQEPRKEVAGGATTPRSQEGGET